MVYVRIPSVLQPFTEHQSIVQMKGETVADVLDNFLNTFSSLRSFLLNEGELSPYVNIYLNAVDVRALLSTPVQDEDELSLIPQFSGG
jgi:sulfur-carrier protein